jgi:uncharacterized membrane protein
MKHFFSHFRTHVFRGLLALIPVVLTVLTLRFIYVFIDQRIIHLLHKYIGVNVPGLGTIVLLCFLYLIGLIASNVIGKQFFGLIERLTSRIPLIKTTYQIGKQLSNTLSLPEGEMFQSVVLIDYIRPGMKAVGFVVGKMYDAQHNQKMLKVFLPTPPNPTSGMMVIVKESEVTSPGWSTDEALKIIISGGIIGPEEIRKVK